MLSAYIWKWKNTDFCAVSVWVSVGPCIPELARQEPAQNRYPCKHAGEIRDA